MATMSSLPLLGSGCLSNGQSSSLEGVENPPEWLTEDNDCGSGSASGYLNLSVKKDEIRESVAVVEYGELTEESQMIVRYTVENGIAKSCSNEAPFLNLLREIDNLALRSYREEHNHSPETTSIHAAGGYYDIERLAASDMVFN